MLQDIRLRAALRSNVLIFADIGVKHASPPRGIGFILETKDMAESALVDAIMVSAGLPGSKTDPNYCSP